MEKERFWRKQVRGHASSGLSVRAWCRKQELSEPSFYAWRRELAERDGQRSPTPSAAASGAAPRPTRRGVKPVTAPSAFLPVTFSEPATSHIELELPSGVVIRVPAHEAAALHSVWQLLTEQRAC